jgi:hypothetical protein
MIDEWWIGRDLEGSDDGLMSYCAGVWLEGLMNTTKHLSEDSQ